MDNNEQVGFCAQKQKTNMNRENLDPTPINRGASTSNTVNTQPQANPQSFANIVRQKIVPTKDLGIILMANNNELKLFDYVKAIGSLVSPKNITHASRIAHDRICIYLKSKKIIDELMINRNSIKIAHMNIPIRRCVTPSRRIILSGVSPIITDEEIETILKNHNLQVVSSVTHLRAGMGEDEYSHIL